MSTITNTANTTRACDGCGQLTPYEPVFYGITDLAASLPHQCAKCTAKAQQEESEQHRRLISDERELEIERVLSPEMRATDINHPNFNRKAWDALSRWTPSSGKWLVIHGETRLSKSRICALLAMRLIRSGVRVEWVTANAFQWAASREFDDDNATRQTARQWLTTWKNTAVLFFDDFGKAGFSKASERHLFELIDHRHSYRLPTAISSNTALEEMISHNWLTPDRGAPIITRILEAAGGAAIKLKTPR